LISSTRVLVDNMVQGVGKGFTRVLEINGVGYRAEVRGGALFFALGYSHPISFQLPKGVTAKVDRQVVVTLEGADRELVGQVAAQLRELRPPEPYKGKGVKYSEERIRRKAGKAAAGATR
jgi:large subunit ribosomal protein L6